MAWPIDNPAAFFDATELSRRAADLNRRIDGICTKLRTLNAADVAVNALINLIDTAMGDLDSAFESTEPTPTATGNIVVNNQADVTDLDGVADGDQFSIQVGSSPPVTIAISTGDTPTLLLSKIDAAANVDTTFTTEGYQQISATANEELILAEVTNTPLAGLGLPVGTFDSSNNAISLRTTTASNFDVMRTQIDQVSGNSSFRGINLLAGDDLMLQLNETGRSVLTFKGETFDASGLGINTAVNNFQLDANIAVAKAELPDAYKALRKFSSRLATDLSISETRKNFGADLANISQQGPDSLMLADLQEESANQLALQTRRDLTTANLSILNGSESSIFRQL